MHPVGPRSPNVYWLRRALVVVVAVVVLIGLVWFAVSKASGGPNPNAAGDTGTESGPGTEELTGVLATGSTGESATGSTGRSNSAGKAPTKEADGTTGTTKSAGKKSTAESTAKKTTAKKSAATKTTAKKSTAKKSTAKKTTAKKSTGKSSAEGTAKKTTAKQSTAKTTAKKTTSAASSTAGSPRDSAPASSTKKPATSTKATSTAPTTDAQGRLLCTDAAISLATTSGSPSYQVGSQPILGLTVTNTSSTACVRDLSGPLQVFTVYTADGTRVWSTDDCFPGEGTDVRMMQPGESLQYNIEWAGTTSQPGCAAERVPVPAGSYTAVARLGQLKAKPTKVEITG